MTSQKQEAGPSAGALDNALAVPHCKRAGFEALGAQERTSSSYALSASKRILPKFFPKAQTERSALRSSTHFADALGGSVQCPLDDLCRRESVVIGPGGTSRKRAGGLLGSSASRTV